MARDQPGLLFGVIRYLLGASLLTIATIVILGALLLLQIIVATVYGPAAAAL